jgi:hypothetical protein
MVWKNIREVSWYETSNPGEFRIIIKYDSSGLKGSLCKMWLRQWVPVLCQIAESFLKGNVPKDKTVNVAQKIRSTVKELKTP